MKAKEYFNKYEERILAETREGSANSVTEMLKDLINEAVTLAEKRRAVLNPAVIGILREVNDKWNAIRSLFEKKYGASPLKQNAFWRYCEATLPDLKEVAAMVESRYGR